MNIRIRLLLSCLTASAIAAKYVDPLGGNDASDGSITAPWKTLQNIHNLADTVYISNSAVCYFGARNDRNPIDVTLLPWGSGRPTITFSNATGTAAIYMNRNPGVGNRLVMRGLTLAPAAAAILIYPRFSSGKTVDIENCVFEMSSSVGIFRWIHMRCDGAYFRFWSNLVYYANTTDTGFFVNNEEFPYTLDIRFNRFYDFYGANAGILQLSNAGCKGIVAQNTAWGCRYFIRATQAGTTSITYKQHRGIQERC